MEAIALVGCGEKISSIMGALQCCLDKNAVCLENVKCFVGTSSGSIGALMLSIGMSPIEIISFVHKNKNFTKRFSTQINLMSVLKSETIDFSKYTDLIKAKVDDHLCYTDEEPLTLDKLYKITGKELVICSYNYSKRKCTNFSHKTWPDLLVYDALQASSALPIIFGQCIIDGDLYIDGGFYNSLGVEIPRQFGISPSKIIGITFSYHNVYDKHRLEDGSYKLFENEPHRFVTDLFYIILYAGQMIKADNAKLQGSLIICCNYKEIDQPTTQAIMDLVMLGYSSASNQIDHWQAKKRKRSRNRRGGNSNKNRRRHNDV